MDKLKIILQAKTNNPQIRSEIYSFKEIIILMFVFIATAVFLDNPANSLNFNIISFEDAIRLNLRPPLIMFAGIFLGPFWGAVTGGMIDVISYNIWNSNLDYVFILTLISALRGFLSGYIFNNFYKKFSIKTVINSIALPHLLISGFFVPLILNWEFSVPLLNNIRTRVTILAFTIPVYTAISYFILKYFKQKKEFHALHAKLKEIVKVDSLTGLSSRREFMDFLEKMISLSRRKSMDLALIMIDIDNFKEINDNYGHAGGDRVLTLMGDILNSEIRQADMAARLGGDEFAVLLVESGLDDAKALADRLKEKIRNAEVSEVKATVTASFGITDLKYDDECKAFLQRADSALYKAKREGKDKIVKLVGGNSYQFLN
ncbi:MAG: GGDEF domain-containing protein [Bacillota bacterium]